MTALQKDGSETDCGMLLQLLLLRGEKTNREGIGKETQVKFSLTRSAVRLAKTSSLSKSHVS